MPFLFDPENRSRLDRPERDAWQMPDRVVDTLGIRPGTRIAEIGAGTGYFTWRLSEKVGPGGHVYAVDLQQEMLGHLRERIAEMELQNVSLHRAGPIETPLADGTADLVFLANVTHEYDDLEAGLAECARIASAEATMAVVDWACRETEAGPPLDHRVSAEEIAAAANASGWTLRESHDFLPNHTFLVFTRAS